MSSCRSASPENNKDGESVQPTNRRSAIVREIFDFEKRYNESLKTLIVDFKEPLEAKLLADDPIPEITILFRCIPALIQASTSLIVNLRKKKNIGAVFTAFAPCLQVYVQYLNNYSYAMKAFKATLCDKARKSKWLSFMAGKQLKFENLLARPVQQIPKYEMLLKELNKHTDDSHPEKLSIARAIVKVRDVAIKNDVAIHGNGLIWQHQDMCHWTNFSDAHSRQLSLAHASGVTKTKIATSSTSFFHR